ncbi:unnamed protein product [Angiostrongylus costaricensis]|uniref:MARVEL domain-containing protein n=1 Tax=Angiostrongylus costaricensis TaxID=334426 RepID=A0A0R3PG08_ANGCS|nr:unnamed protein product [Angiostrongylus costaricensis]
MSGEDEDFKEDRPPMQVLSSILASLRLIDSARERSELEREDLHATMRIVLAVLMFILLLVLSIHEVVIAAAKMTSCPVAPLIPVWLIVSGLMGILRNTGAIVCSIYEDKKRRAIAIRDCILGLFTALWIMWLIVGSYWTYSVYDKVVYQSNKENYCDQLLYCFTFSLITTSYVIIGITFCCMIYCVVFLCCHNSSVAIIT